MMTTAYPLQLSTEGIDVTEQEQKWNSDGKEVKLMVNASGLGNLSYQWMKDGEDIDQVKYPNCSGIDTATLTIAPFTPEYEGDYSCLIKDESGQNIESGPFKVKGNATCMGS